MLCARASLYRCMRCWNNKDVRRVITLFSQPVRCLQANPASLDSRHKHKLSRPRVLPPKQRLHRPDMPEHPSCTTRPWQPDCCSEQRLWSLWPMSWPSCASGCLLYGWRMCQSGCGNRASLQQAYMGNRAAVNRTIHNCSIYFQGVCPNSSARLPNHDSRGEQPAVTKRRDSRAGRQKQELEQETNEGTHIGEKLQPIKAGYTYFNGTKQPGRAMNSLKRKRWLHPCKECCENVQCDSSKGAKPSLIRAQHGLTYSTTEPPPMLNKIWL